MNKLSFKHTNISLNKKVQDKQSPFQDLLMVIVTRLEGASLLTNLLQLYLFS